MCVCGGMYICECVSAPTCDSQKRTSDPTELELQVVEGDQMWVLEPILPYPEGAVCTLNL